MIIVVAVAVAVVVAAVVIRVDIHVDVLDRPQRCNGMMVLCRRSSESFPCCEPS